MVDNQGSFLDGSVAWPFAESDWNGLSPADCVFPTVRLRCIASSGPPLRVQAPPTSAAAARTSAAYKRRRKPHRLALTRAVTYMPTLLRRHFTAVHLYCWALHGAGARPCVARCSARRHSRQPPSQRIDRAAAPGRSPQHRRGAAVACGYPCR
jgi:hypothetical protein